ncbi:uncharacterized protein LOC116851046 isoform X1 [Odontomachus brunneus]|uniref:uncharacterized protein LOC116851046 isoform X1 n=2 Tax=Odontomachus brunneus TaxID=486640 RepID=UPI0013F1924C|nr:uncharacterized protein LOC116851046 isoform X1 [Odontomachus brunneus]
MRSCYLCGRKATWLKAGNISLHKFPNKQHLRQKWIIACSLQETDDVSNLYICSIHFKLPQNFIVQAKCRLPPGAVPNEDINNIIITSPTKRDVQNDAATEIPHISLIENSINRNISESFKIKIISVASEAIDFDVMNSIVKDSEVINSEVINSGVMDSVIMDSKVMAFEVIDSEVKDSKVMGFGAIDSGIMNSEVMAFEVIDSVVKDSEVIDSGVMDSAIMDSEVVDSKVIDSEILDNAVQPILAASTSHLYSGENVSTPPKKRLFAEPRYISEITIADMSPPKRAKRVINFIKRVDDKKRKKIKSLQDRNRKLQKRIATLQELVSHLKKSRL